MRGASGARSRPCGLGDERPRPGRGLPIPAGSGAACASADHVQGFRQAALPPARNAPSCGRRRAEACDDREPILAVAETRIRRAGIDPTRPARSLTGVGASALPRVETGKGGLAPQDARAGRRGGLRQSRAGGRKKGRLAVHGADARPVLQTLRATGWPRPGQRALASSSIWRPGVAQAGGERAGENREPPPCLRHRDCDGQGSRRPPRGKRGARGGCPPPCLRCRDRGGRGSRRPPPGSPHGEGSDGARRGDRAAPRRPAALRRAGAPGRSRAASLPAEPGHPLCVFSQYLNHQTIPSGRISL